MLQVNGYALSWSITQNTGTVLLEGTNVSEGRGTTRPFEFVGGPLQEGDEIVNQEEFRGFQLPLRRTTQRQHRVVEAIQVELIACPVGIRRVQVGIQRDGPVGFGNRQLMLAGARQRETGEQSMRPCIARVTRSPRFQRPLFPFEIAREIAVV